MDGWGLLSIHFCRRTPQVKINHPLKKVTDSCVYRSYLFVASIQIRDVWKTNAVRLIITKQRNPRMRETTEERKSLRARPTDDRCPCTINTALIIPLRRQMPVRAAIGSVVPSVLWSTLILSAFQSSTWLSLTLRIPHVCYFYADMAVLPVPVSVNYFRRNIVQGGGITYV